MKLLKYLLGLHIAVFGESFAQILQMIYVHSPQRAVLKAKEQSLLSEVAASQSALYPTLSTSASYLYNSEVPSLELSIPFPSPLGTQTMQRKLGDHDRVEWSLDAQYLLWEKGGRQSLIDLKKHQVQSMDYEIKMLEDQLLTEFWMLLINQKIPLVKIQMLEYKAKNLQELLDLTKLKIQKGTEIPLQYLVIQTQQSLIKQQILSERQKYDSLQNEINRMVGVNVENISPPFQEIPLDLPQYPMPKLLEIQEFEHAQKSLSFKDKSLQGDYFPKLYSLASYKMANPGLNQSSNEWMSYFQVGLQFSWKIWDGGQIQSQRKILQLQNLEILEQVRVIQEKWTQKQSQLQSSWRSNQCEKTALEQTQILADSVLVLSKQLYRKGVLSLSDVLLRSNEAAEAKYPLELWKIKAQILLLQWSRLYQFPTRSVL